MSSSRPDNGVGNQEPDHLLQGDRFALLAEGNAFKDMTGLADAQANAGNLLRKSSRNSC